ncbi:MAG: helix-turn-helix domain-containing protein [Chloroflexi bacterium]|nr:helix-turn-helix domain-containing protein [Chloroflexota bacterium]
MNTANRGLSLPQLAKQLGVSHTFLSQIRNGKRPLLESLKEKLVALCAYYLLIADK